MKYVAKGDAVSDEEEEIEGFIAQRREKREKMLSDIERRRRMKLAERKASMARKWSEAEDGEDLATLLRDGEHDIQVFEEPENPDTGKPLGITYFRIDSDRVLMIKAPLEIPQKQTQPIVDGSPDDTQPHLLRGCHPSLHRGCHPSLLRGCHPSLQLLIQKMDNDTFKPHPCLR